MAMLVKNVSGIERFNGQVCVATLEAELNNEERMRLQIAANSFSKTKKQCGDGPRFFLEFRGVHVIVRQQSAGDAATEQDVREFLRSLRLVAATNQAA